MKHVKLLGLAVLLAGLAFGPVWGGNEAPTCAADKAGGGDKAGRPERKGPGHGLASELGLSAEKAGEIKGLMQAARETMLKLKADRDLCKADLDRLLAADPLDANAISAAADKLAQVNAEMTKAMVKARLAVNAALTPEQRARMHELRKGMLERFKKRGEGRHEQRQRGGGRSKDAPESPGTAGI